jgi:hypothetical protein
MKDKQMIRINTLQSKGSIGNMFENKGKEEKLCLIEVKELKINNSSVPLASSNLVYLFRNIGIYSIKMQLY